MENMRPFESLHINEARLMARIEQFAALAPTRVAFSDEDLSGRKLMVDLMQDAGLAVRIDPAGNLIGRMAGRNEGPAILFGSHIDTVRNGGKYDGVLGSVAGLECIATLRECEHITNHPLELVIFASEEGQEFAPLYGSRSMVGALKPDEFRMTNRSGTTLAKAVAYVGGDSSRIQNALRSPEEIHSFLELHIEQGPNLESLRIPIGVVNGISGVLHIEVHIKGTAAHSGTTSMEFRHDALVAAAALVVATEETAHRKKLCHVATIGELTATPNSANIIPGAVDLILELRDLDTRNMARAYEHLRQTAANIEAATGTSFEFRQRVLIEPVPSHESVLEAITASCDDLGLRYHRMASGAGHDAQIMARIAPTGMIFVPSVNGVSHSELEFTSAENCGLGANVLLRAILKLDDLSHVRRTQEASERAQA
jgi:beta-ureidopropionase / N-carbamoyl-L-amino-acid hydrolase